MDDSYLSGDESIGILSSESEDEESKESSGKRNHEDSNDDNDDCDTENEDDEDIEASNEMKNEDGNTVDEICFSDTLECRQFISKVKNITELEIILEFKKFVTAMNECNSDE